MAERKQPSWQAMLFILIIEIVALIGYVFIMDGILPAHMRHGLIGFAMSVPALLLALCMGFTCYKIDCILYSKK